MHARSTLLLLLLLALVACGGNVGSQQEGSGNGRSSEEQRSEGRGSKEQGAKEQGSGGQKSKKQGSGGQATEGEEETTSGSAGSKTVMAPMETTGASGAAAMENGATPSKNNERRKNERANNGGLASSSTLVSGATDETDGPLKGGRMVSYYGHPLSGAMGILGQYKPEDLVGRLKAQAQEYTRLTPDRPAIPTIELIASVAQPIPGPDGLYLTRTSPEFIEQYSKVAREQDCLLLLDVQIGYSSIADEIETLLPYLKREHVHLAIDPEYDMDPGEVPGQQFGSSTGEEIMQAARTLSQLVEENDLPPKVLVVHQFRYDMLINKGAIQPVPNVEIVIHADGFGTPEAKIGKYNQLVRDQPIQYGGFKLFYTQDYPLMSPRQTLRVLKPDPAVISYQ